MRKSSTREVFVERVKYLFGTSFNELSLEDRFNLIAIKLVLEPMEYHLLKRWYMNKWKYEKLAQELMWSNTQTKAEVSKAITKAKPFVFNYNNSPFRKENDKRVAENYINLSDRVIESFLISDSVIMSAEEFIAVASESLLKQYTEGKK